MTTILLVLSEIENIYKEFYTTLQKEIEAQNSDSHFLLTLRCDVVSALGAFKVYKIRLETPDSHSTISS
jgi:hypothetical protein